MIDKIKEKLYLNNNSLTITKKSLKELSLSAEKCYQIYYNYVKCPKCKFISFSKGYQSCICQFNNEKEFYESLKDKNGFIQGSIYKKYNLNKEKVQRVLQDFPKCKICGDNALFTNSAFKSYCIKHKSEYRSYVHKNLSKEKKEKIIQKRKETCLKKYGNECSLASEENKEKAKKTKKERYGNENYCNLEKIKKTKKERYGNENYCNSEKANKTKEQKSELKKKEYRENLSNSRINFINSKRTNISDINEKYFRDNFIKNNKFLFKECQEYTNIPTSTLNYLKKEFHISENNMSNNETIEDKINKIFNNSFILRNRNIISPLELDLYSKQHNFAIEYNGLIWHSYGKSKHSMFNNYNEENYNRHLDKTILCENKGIQLFHIFENEWLDKNKKSIWISIIRDKLNKNKKIGARKCTIKEVPTKEAKEFINKNHMQGYTNAKIKIGLYYNNILVSIMTFSKPRFNKNVEQGEYELIRFCTKKNITIQGGGSKILKYFEKTYKPKSLISYANRRWSTGNFYIKVGFTFIKDTKPNYFYFRPGENILYSRNMFQKHKLSNILENFNPNLTESENMYNNNYRKIYDSGNKKYIKYYT